MRVPERTCVVCKKVLEKKSLLRVVKTAEGEILLDPSGRKNGRGAYICKDSLCFESLKKTKGLDRSFKCSISSSVYESLLEEVNSLIKG